MMTTINMIMMDYDDCVAQMFRYIMLTLIAYSLNIHNSFFPLLLVVRIVNILIKIKRNPYTRQT